METFTASNGVEVKISVESNETYLLGKGGAIEGGTRRWTVATGNTEGIAALREFFQYERDQELGRWRSPLGFYVYPLGEDDGARIVLVLDAATGQTQTYFEGAECTGPGILYEAANDYFAAHPVPKPWHDAKPGDVWVLTVAGKEHPWGFDPIDQRFVYAGGESWLRRNDEMITAGRRIWPEVE